METTPQVKEEKIRNCDYCGNPYSYMFDTSRFCSENHRNLFAKKKKKENTPTEVKVITGVSTQQKELPSLPPAAQYIINHLEKETKRWEDKYDKACVELENVKNQYDTLKETHNEFQHKQTLQGLENAQPSFIEKLLAGLPPGITEKVADKLLGYIPDAQPGGSIAGTNGQLDGEASVWANGMMEWFSSIPKESQAVAAGLINELTKVAPDQLGNVVTRMINILQSGSTIDQPKRQAAYGGF